MSNEVPIHCILSATITKSELMEIINDIANNIGFDDKSWSIWDAERLETLAKMIRHSFEPPTF